MSWLLVTGLLVGGLALLTVGGEFLVRGASKLAAAAGLTPLVVGLTVVAFGTSAPELAVSIQSALSGPGGGDIALGNVIGSNIFNILFILGVSALIVPLVVARQLIRQDVPVMIGASGLMLLLALDGRISRLDGVILFTGVVLYTGSAVWKSRREERARLTAAPPSPEETRPRGARSVLIDLALVLGGLALLVLGARWFVAGAVDIARFLGISELVIGLTIVAAGTSLPEVAASLIAAVRGERDIAVGNVIGSNIFNILCVLGASGLVAPAGIAVSPAALTFDIPIMLAVAVACLPIFFTGYSIARWEGAIFLGSYLAYATFLVLAATHNPALETFTNGMLLVLPLIACTLVWTTLQSIRRSRGAKEP